MLLSLQVVSFAFNNEVSAYHGSLPFCSMLMSLEISLNLQTLTQDTVKFQFNRLM